VFAVAAIFAIVIIIWFLCILFKLRSSQNKTKPYFTMCVLLVLLFLLMPVFINEAYRFGRGYIAYWDAVDFLQFYGAILSLSRNNFIGRVIIMAKQQVKE